MPDFICPICGHRTRYPAGYRWPDGEGPECEECDGKWPTEEKPEDEDQFDEYGELKENGSL